MVMSDEMNDRTRGLSWLLLLVGFFFPGGCGELQRNPNPMSREVTRFGFRRAAATVNCVADFEVNIGFQLGLAGMKVN